MLEDIKSLKSFSKKFNRPIVVTFSIDADREGFHITTYGKNKILCKLAGSFGDQIAEAINSGSITPPETEPFDVPSGSTLWVKKQ